jgi:hypothetical protein
MPIVPVLTLSAFLAMVMALSGVVLHGRPWEAAAHCVGSLVVLQFVYVAVSLTLDLARFRRLIPDAQNLIGRRTCGIGSPPSFDT